MSASFPEAPARREGPRPAAVAAMLFGAATLVGPRSAAADPAPPTVAVARVAEGCVSRLVAASGLIVPRTMALVVAGVPGLRVAEVSARQGDIVAAGQVLALLVPGQIVPKDQIVPKEGSGGPGQPLRAPARGLVVRDAAEVGLVPEPAAALFAIAADGEMEMAAEVFAAHVPELNAGQGARVRLDDGREFAAHLRLVPAEIDPATQRGEARLSLDGAPALSAGAVASARIETRRACGLTVPRVALTGANGGEASVRVVQGGTVDIRRVRTGLVTEDLAQVVEGLAADEAVVAEGEVGLPQGAAVRAVAADGPDGR